MLFECRSSRQGDRPSRNRCSVDRTAGLVVNRLSDSVQLGIGRVWGGFDNNTSKTVFLPFMVFLWTKAGVGADE